MKRARLRLAERFAAITEALREDNVQAFMVKEERFLDSEAYVTTAAFSLGENERVHFSCLTIRKATK